MNFLIKLTAQQATDNPGLFYTLGNIPFTSIDFVEQQEAELLLSAAQTQDIKNIIANATTFVVEKDGSYDLDGNTVIDTILLEEGDQVEFFANTTSTLSLVGVNSIDFPTIDISDIARYIVVNSVGDLVRTPSLSNPVISSIQTSLSNKADIVSLTQEISDRQAADTTLQTNIDTEQAARISSDIALGDSISTKADKTTTDSLNLRVNDLESLTASGVRFIGDYDASTNTPELENPPNTSINKGDLYYVSVAGQFYNQDLEIGDAVIAKQDTPVDAGDWTFIQTNLTAGSIKNLYESVANTNAFTDALLSKLNAIEAGAEVNEVTQAELDAETASRVAADNNLQSQIDSLPTPEVTQSELDDVISDVNNNTQDLALEIQDRENADTALGIRIDNVEIDVTAKVSADGSVTTHNDVTNAGSGIIISDSERIKLSGIETGAEVNEVTQAELDTVSNNLTQEINNRVSSDANLASQIATKAEQNDLDGEESARIAADTNLQNQINALPPVEVTQAELDAVQSDVDNNTNDIVLEVAARENADQNLATSITSETNARVAGDAALQTQIGNLTIQDLNNVDFTNAPITGGFFTWNGTDVVPNNRILVDSNGCIFRTIDDSGADWCNEQIGTNGSAFMILKKALGTIASPTAVTNGTKIGGFAFVGEDEFTTGVGYVGAEVASFAIQDHSETIGASRLELSATGTGSKTREVFLQSNNNAEPNLPQFLNSRNDGSTENALYTDQFGNLQHGPIKGVSANLEVLAGTFNGNSSGVIYTDDYVIITWLATNKQPQYELRSTAPIAWNRNTIYIMKINGSNSTINGTSAFRRTTGRPPLQEDTPRFFSRNGSRDSNYDMENSGSYLECSLMKETYTANFPAYRLYFSAGATSNISVKMEIIT